MLTTASLGARAFNLLLQANPKVQQQLATITSNHANPSIQLNLLGLSFNLQITPRGNVIANQLAANCKINFSFTSSWHYWLNSDPMYLLRQLPIEGNRSLAYEFLAAIAELDPNKLFFASTNPILGVFGLKLSQALQALSNYQRRTWANANFSLSQYLQYEARLVEHKHQLEQFYAQVDGLKERTDLLTKRINMLKL